MKNELINLWGDKINEEWIIFHDESICNESRFLYHGYLFINRKNGNKILEELFKNGDEIYDKEIHFCKLTGLGTNRTKIALQWLEHSRKWLKSKDIRFYFFGVNLDNINCNLYSDIGPSINEKIYRRFFEIGIMSSLKWFGIKPELVGYFFYDQGKQDIDRYCRALNVCGTDTIIQPLFSDYLVSKRKISKFLQLTDVLLGTIRKCFTPVGKSAGQTKCVESFHDIVTRFNNAKTAYNIKSSYYKNICINFFPKTNNITPEIFFAKTMEYHLINKDIFYCDRETYIEQKARFAQVALDI